MTGADESSKDIGPMLPGFETCEIVTEDALNSLGLWPTPTSDTNLRSSSYAQGGKPLGLAVSQALTSSAGVSPASPSVTPADAQENPIAAGFGLSSTESFARLNPDGSWSRMYQGCGQLTMDGSLEEYSETWPKRGTMRSGSTYPLPTPAPPTSESESSLWPTPTSRDYKDSGANTDYEKIAKKSRLAGVVNWPTPQSRDWKGSSGRSQKGEEYDLPTATGGQLNPMWVEWLMGFPLGWTDLEDLATPSSRRSRK